MNKPNFFIIGAPKCGTTSLAFWLSEHPNIYMSPKKEPNFYNTDHNHGNLTRDEYLALFKNADEHHEAIGEASVWYLYSKEAIKNIQNDIPEAKFIVMLRNPIDMVYSYHQQAIFAGLEDIKDFEKAWDARIDRKRNTRIPLLCNEPKLIWYDEICKLGSQMKSLLNEVPSEKVQPILLDDIETNTLEEWKKILSFVGVKYMGRKKFPIKNSAKRRRSLGLKYMMDIYSRLRQYFDLNGLGTGILTYLDEKNVKPQERTPLNYKMKQKLRDFYKGEIELLGNVIDRDLSNWLDV